MPQSQIAALKANIAAEYMAGKLGLTGLASGVGTHQYITARMERMGQTFEALANLVGSKNEAMQIVAEVQADLPEETTRSHMIDFLRSELDKAEQTDHLLDYLEDAWETVDLLSWRFGRENALKIIAAPPASSDFVSP
jgi:hypothetical protein